MLQQLEVFCIHPEVFQDFRVMHVVWIITRDGEITEAHHFLGDVNGEGAVDTGPVGL